jgi:hypothetical protein
MRMESGSRGGCDGSALGRLALTVVVVPGSCVSGHIYLYYNTPLNI